VSSLSRDHVSHRLGDALDNLSDCARERRKGEELEELMKGIKKDSVVFVTFMTHFCKTGHKEGPYNVATQRWMAMDLNM